MRGVRGVLDDISTSLEEDQGLTAVFGAIAGGFLAFAIERYGADSDPETFAFTVDRARASLLSALALVFIGLSIVLAPPVTVSVSVLFLLLLLIITGVHLDAAGRQILLYGGEDRTVTAALLRLGRQGERFADSDRDRQLARTFADDVEAARVAGAGSQGSAW